MIRFFYFYRINRELHSWVQDHYRKEENPDKKKPVTIPDSNSISIPTNLNIERVPDSSEQQHIPRKVAVLHRRTSKFVFNFMNKIYPREFSISEHNRQRKVNFNHTEDMNKIMMILFMLLIEKMIHFILYHSNE